MYYRKWLFELRSLALLLGNVKLPITRQLKHHFKEPRELALVFWSDCVTLAVLVQKELFGLDLDCCDEQIFTQKSHVLAFACHKLE
jgi:hypothetical protein